MGFRHAAEKAGAAHLRAFPGVARGAGWAEREGYLRTRHRDGGSRSPGLRCVHRERGAATRAIHRPCRELHRGDGAVGPIPQQAAYSIGCGGRRYASCARLLSQERGWKAALRRARELLQPAEGHRISRAAAHAEGISDAARRAHRICMERHSRDHAHADAAFRTDRRTCAVRAWLFGTWRCAGDAWAASCSPKPHRESRNASMCSRKYRRKNFRAARCCASRS